MLMSGAGPGRSAVRAPNPLRVALFVSAACLVAPLARAIEPTPVISPAQAEQIGEMLGIGTKDLPEQCHIVGVSIDHAVAVAKYACPTAKAEISLQHRDAEVGAGTVTRTAKVSLVAATKTPDTLELIHRI